MIVMDIQDKIDEMTQGEKSIAEYSTKLKRLWSELDYYDLLTITDSVSATVANTWVERRRVIHLMNGLNSEFETRRAMICHQSPLPRMVEVIAALSQEESGMKVMTTSGNSSAPVRSALLKPITNDRVCYNCGKIGILVGIALFHIIMDEVKVIAVVEEPSEDVVLGVGVLLVELT